MRDRMRNIIVVLFFLLFSRAEAQDIFKVHEVWSDVTIWYKLSPKTKVGGDLGYRTTLDQFTFHQFYIRPTIVWKPKPLYSLSFAVSNFYTHELENINLDELRFAQQASLFWPKIGSFQIHHRLRFEERFYYINDTKENSQRARYRLGIKSPSFHLFGIGSPFYTEITWEDFMNLGSSFLNYWGNTHRWEVVIGNKVSKKVKVGLHYIFQSTRIADRSFEVQQNIIRVRVGYTIN